MKYFCMLAALILIIGLVVIAPILAASVVVVLKVLGLCAIAAVIGCLVGMGTKR